MYDVVVRGGTLIDGSGGPRRSADVAVAGAEIAEVGRVAGRGRREIDADGLLVTPGLVDVHTHYDGQVAWDPLLTPSSWHGVTTVVMGNCGVGFAPAAPDRHEFLIALMEGVEDIPGEVLAEALSWKWESFPEYLGAIDSLPHAIDFGAQLPHGALRTYAMGERGADHAARASASEIELMARLAREAMEAGAIGFSTSRTVNHRARGGAPTPSLTASAEELVGIARGVGAAGRGVLQGISDFTDVEAEFGLLRRMAAESGRPLSFTVLQNPARPELWRELLRRTSDAVREGVPMCGQVAARAIGMLVGLAGGRHPFAACPSYRALAELPLAERVARMRDPEVRGAILAELRGGDPRVAALAGFANLYELGDPPDYEPAPERSIAARAAAEGRDPAGLAYDLLLARGGRALLYAPVMNYAAGDLEVTREMLLHPHTIPGLGDAGAHVGLICDASFPTTLLSHWGRDRRRGERLPLEWLIRRQARDTAEWVGLRDRGLVAPGMKADLNLIEYERLGPCEPELAFDLPTGARRLLQRARGYRMTLVSGEVVMQDGEHTGALPGRLVRGPQASRA